MSTYVNVYQFLLEEHGEPFVIRRKASRPSFLLEGGIIKA
jgi:hypothetical protein